MPDTYSISNIYLYSLKYLLLATITQVKMNWLWTSYIYVALVNNVSDLYPKQRDTVEKFHVSTIQKKKSMYQKRDFSSGTNQKLNSRFLPRSLPWQIVGLWLTTFDALKNLPRTKAVRVLGKRKGDTINHIERTDEWNARQKTYRHISTDLAPQCSDRMITACTRNKFSAVFDMMPHSSVENATLFRQPIFCDFLFLQMLGIKK